MSLPSATARKGPWPPRSYSDYFIRGYASHGYNPAPDYPASHGCLRLPIVDAIWVYNWLALGDWVDVYN